MMRGRPQMRSPHGSSRAGVINCRPLAARERSALAAGQTLPSSALVIAFGKVGVVELQRLLVQLGLRAFAFVLPRGDVTEIVVVAKRLTLFRLVLFAEVAAARFLAVQRVLREQLTEFEEV